MDCGSLCIETLLARLDIYVSQEASMVCDEVIQFREAFITSKRNLELPDEDPFLNITWLSEATFLNPVITDISTKWLLVVEGTPAHCGILRDFPWLYLEGACDIFPQYDNRKCLQPLPDVTQR